MKNESAKNKQQKVIAGRVSADVSAKLKIKAFKEGLTMQQLVERWATEYTKGVRL